MVKQEIEDDQFDSSKTLFTDLSAHPTPEPDLNSSGVSAMYPNSSTCDIIRTPGGLVPYPGAETHPYQTASWDSMWNVMDLHSRQNVRKEYSLNSCKAIRIPLAARRQNEAFHAFFMRPLYFPLALRQQETAHLIRREFLFSGHERSSPPCWLSGSILPGA